MFVGGPFSKPPTFPAKLCGRKCPITNAQGFALIFDVDDFGFNVICKLYRLCERKARIHAYAKFMQYAQKGVDEFFDV